MASAPGSKPSGCHRADGSVATKTDAKGQKTEYTYDATYGRVTTIKRKPNGTTEDPCQQTNFTYGTTPGTSTNGRLSTVTWGRTTCATGNRAFTESYTYTPAGAVTSKTLSASIPSGAISLSASYTYDNEGKMTSVKYPDTRNDGGPSGLVTGPTYTYGFDSFGRPTTLTDGTTQWVSYAHYTAAGQLDELRYLQTGGQYWQETRTYNERLQLTRITNKNYITGSQTPFLDEEYRFSATTNNGRIASKKDHTSGEDVTFAYDGLQRLITASTTAGPTWALAWTYDGFGNRLSQTVTAGSGPPNSSLVVDPATNRLTGSSNYQYDANGNMTRMPASTTFATMTYDVENRIVTAADPTSGTDSYAYSPDNKRIWKKKPNGSEEFYFYGLGGQKLGTYQISTAGQQGYPPYFAVVSTELYFGGRKIRSQGQAIAIDRLGSVRHTGAGVTRRYFPYGEEQVVSTNDQDKFGTYFRDLTTGLDYADQRYFSAGLGRFLSADAYQASAGSGKPSSWNRYPYVEGDPANFVDPDGRSVCSAGYSFEECFGYGGPLWHGFMPWEAPYGCWDTIRMLNGNAVGLVTWDSICIPYAQAGSPLLIAALTADWLYAQERLTRETLDPLARHIESWALGEDWKQGQVTITLSQSTGVYFSQYLASAGVAGGVIILGGTPIGWTITVTGAVVLTGVHLWQTGLLQKLFDQISRYGRLTIECQRVKNRCINRCSSEAIPTNDDGFKFWNCLNRCMEAEGCL